MGRLNSLCMQKYAILLTVILSFPALIADTCADSGVNPENAGIQLKTVLLGGVANAFMGQSLSLDADLNGDGKNDLVVSANGDGSRREGSVYLFFRAEFGQLTNLSEADMRISGEETGDLFGWALTAEGDVNGDGRKDLIVSALKSNRVGRIYVFTGGWKNKGKTLRAAEADCIISSKDSTETFGFVICADGDLNNDGINDLVVSAPSNNEAAPEAGKIYIFNGGGWGKKMTTDDAACVIAGEAPNSSFGSSISFRKDYTGNGIPDLAIGAFFTSLDSSNSGRVYLFEGRRKWPQKVLPQEAALIIQGYHKESWLGTAVEFIGDINGDGRNELLAGASGEYVDGDDAGAAYLFYGGDLRGTVSVRKADAHLVSSRIGNNFGTQIARAGDIDRDGKEDWAISEPGGIIAQENARGRVYVFMTSMLGKQQGSSIIEEPVPGNNFGNAISIGDITGDGFPEIGIGANWDNAAGEKSGKVVIFTIRP